MAMPDFVGQRPMKTIEHYVAPSPLALLQLQRMLGRSDEQMAELAGLTACTPWSSYTGGPDAHSLGRQRLFYMAARQVLDEAAWLRVLARMQEMGAEFAYEEPASASPEPAVTVPQTEETLFGMSLISRAGAFHEMEQLREFAHFANADSVSQFVQRAFYDSQADICRFTLARTDKMTPTQRDRIFDAASRTITQFEFDGHIYRGGIPPESDG